MYPEHLHSDPVARRRSSWGKVWQLASTLRRRVFSSRAIAAYWLINVTALCVLIGWIYTDGRFADLAVRIKRDLLLVASGLSSVGQGPELASRLVLLKALCVLAAVTASGMVLGLFFGSGTHRRVTSWLSLTLLAAVWLTLWATWPELHWRGQAYRLRSSLPEMQLIANSLVKNWPMGDGERAELGPFLAYPQDKPEMLMLLTQAGVPSASISYSAVEQSALGALRFKLTGNELGAWLEWHPSSDKPRAFVGGLQQEFEIERFSPLGENWFLVRYK